MADFSVHHIQKVEIFREVFPQTDNHKEFHTIIIKAIDADGNEHRVTLYNSEKIEVSSNV